MTIFQILTLKPSLFATGENGSNAFGYSSGSTFVPILIMLNVESITSGLYHTVIKKTDGSIWSSAGTSSGDSGQVDSENPKVWVEITVPKHP